MSARRQGRRQQDRRLDLPAVVELADMRTPGLRTNRWNAAGRDLDLHEVESRHGSREQASQGGRDSPNPPKARPRPASNSSGTGVLCSRRASLAGESEETCRATWSSVRSLMV